MKRKYKTTLVIGDAHADPNFSNERFTAAGNFILDHRPDNIVEIGDFGNLDSISFHNKGRPLLKEGMRLKDDLDSMVDAHNKLMTPLRKFNKLRGSWRKKQYRPNLLKFLGNHEDRVKRYVAEIPELEGFVPDSDLVGAERDGWEIVPYREYRHIGGVAFTHVPMNTGVNKPICGKYICARAAEQSQTTVVFGHQHSRQIHSLNRNSPDGKYGQRVDGICVGCYFDYEPEYVRGNEGTLNWWRGLILLTHVRPGEVDIQTFDIERIKGDYL